MSEYFFTTERFIFDYESKFGGYRDDVDIADDTESVGDR